jgi:hypothetical protein
LLAIVFILRQEQVMHKERCFIPIRLQVQILRKLAEVVSSLNTSACNSTELLVCRVLFEMYNLSSIQKLKIQEADCGASPCMQLAYVKSKNGAIGLDQVDKIMNRT